MFRTLVVKAHLMSIFGRLKERPLPEPDWGHVRSHMGAEQPIATSAGWFIGNGIDHPCGVYLTDAALYVDVRPDASLVGFETISAPFHSWSQSGVGRSDRGAPRLVVVFDPVGRSQESDIRGIAVDLPRKTGAAFGAIVSEAYRSADARPTNTPTTTADRESPDDPGSPPPKSPPEGWQHDPTGHYEFRYWDGSQWTVHVATGGRQSIDPIT